VLTGPLRRAAHRAPAVALMKKSVLDPRVDPMDPLLGTFGSLLMGGDFCFQLRYPILGRAPLVQKFLRGLRRVCTFLRRRRPLVQHLQYRLACLVELIGAVRHRGTFRPRKRKHFRLEVVTNDCDRVSHSPLRSLSIAISSVDCFNCGVPRLFHEFQTATIFNQ
jgi:hypothetical protein